jgi:hypothetical protein
MIRIKPAVAIFPAFKFSGFLVFIGMERQRRVYHKLAGFRQKIIVTIQSLINRSLIGDSKARNNRFFAVLSGIKIICVSIRRKIHSSILKGLNSFSPRLARFLEGLPWVIAIIFHNPEGVES